MKKHGSVTKFLVFMDESLSGNTPDEIDWLILYATVAELPEDAGLYDVIDALNEAGSLSTFVGALRKFLDDAARPRGDTSAL